MKKTIPFAVAVLAASFAFSNSIEWALDNIDDYGVVSGDYKVAFLNAASYEIDMKTGLASLKDGSSADGNNVYEEYVNTGSDRYAYGEWQDNASAPTSYYLAIFDTASSSYYALSESSGLDSADPYMISTSNMAVSGLYGDDSSKFIASDVLADKHFRVVPEPATAALALAGVALLFRRRKA